MSSHRDSPIRIPIACTLQATDAQTQAQEWRAARASATSVSAIDAGVRLTLPASMSQHIDDLAEREVACCAFLNITTSTDDDEVVVEITTADPDALPVIAHLAGIEIP